MIYNKCRVFALCSTIAAPLWGQHPDSVRTSNTHPIPVTAITTATGERDPWRVGSAITVIDVDSVLRMTPATTITEILESRVPGLTVMHSSGVPGAPSMLYLRGQSNVAASSQPIVILDGVKLSINRSAPPSANLASLAGGALQSAPSALDQLDPHSIATIEVLHGPAAAALYGTDAAAGVIVLTTKRGGRQSGEGNAFHVTASFAGGWSSLLGAYPNNFFRFGSTVSGSGGFCPGTDPTCVTIDSVVRFQALNSSRYSPFGDGSHADGSVTIAGALSALAYSVTGSASGTTGILQLPALEATHFQQMHGFAAPDWMQTPDHYGTQSGVGTFSLPLSRQGSIAVTGMLFNSTQQRSSLEDAIPGLLGVYLNADTAQAEGFLPDYTQRSTSHSLSSMAGATVQWPLASWLPLQGTVGVDHVKRNDRLSVPVGYSSGADSLGFLQTGDALGTTTTGALSTLLPQLPLGFAHITTALGVSALRTSNMTSLAVHDPTNGADTPLQLTSSSQFTPPTASTVSGFIEPRLDLTSRLFVNAGVRWDQNHVTGLPNAVSAYPHIDASWIASDEPFLPIKPIFSLLRFRVAYGYAGSQAGMSPLVSLTNPAASSLPVSLNSLEGWIYTHPERSHEFEGGADADLLKGRLSLSVTGYRKMTHAMIPSPLPILVSPGETPISPTDFLSQNTADVRNTGVEGGVTVHVLQNTAIAWTLGVTASHNSNVVQSLKSNLIQQTDLDFLGTRIVAGAPLFSRWARPVVNVVDANHDGVIEPNEFQLGDSAVLLGSEIPRNIAAFNSSLSLFGGRITAATTVEYEDGFSQANGAALAVSQSGTSFFGNTVNDPKTSLQQQAEVEAVPQTLIGVMQTVHTLRWSELSVAYHVPHEFANRLRLSALSVAFQGSNLALHTNYRGIDPSVNALPTGYGVMDLGEVPLPRTWDLRITLGT